MSDPAAALKPDKLLAVSWNESSDANIRCKH
jgi:hypothetical protein